MRAKRWERRAGRLYEVPCTIFVVLVGLAVVVPRFLVKTRPGPAPDAAPIDSTAAVGSG